MISRQMLWGTVLAVPSLLVPMHRILAEASTEQISIQFDNGAPPVKDGEAKPEYGESFQLSPGESFSVGSGSAFFSLNNFPEQAEQVKFTVEITPGDRLLNLSLPGETHITTDQPQKVTVLVSEGEATSIAYGYDMKQQVSANIKFTYEGIVATPQRDQK